MFEKEVSGQIAGGLGSMIYNVRTGNTVIFGGPNYQAYCLMAVRRPMHLQVSHPVQYKKKKRERKTRIMSTVLFLQLRQ